MALALMYMHPANIWPLIPKSNHQGSPGKYGAPQIVLATGPGNLAAVQVLIGILVQFDSRLVQKPDSLCLYRAVTWTGHKPLVVCPGFSYSRAKFSQSQNFASNYVFEF